MASIADIHFELAVPITIRVNPDHVKMWPLETDADLLVEAARAPFSRQFPRMR